MAIDVWDGGPAQVDIFVANSDVTYPTLMYGGAAGITNDYNCSYDYLFVIGGDGIILWRGNYDDVAIRAAIDQGLAGLVSPTPIIPTADHLLMANYPNPFNPITKIPFELAPGPGPVPVQLSILDLRGRLVSTLVDEYRAAGQRYEATWNGTDNTGRRQPSGTYFVMFKAGNIYRQQTITLVK